MTAKGYWIARIDVENADRYPEYVQAATPAYQEFGASFKVRGGQCQGMEGQHRARNVVIEFPSYQAALDCYNSEQYGKARAIRQEIATGELVIVEGPE